MDVEVYFRGWFVGMWVRGRSGRKSDQRDVFMCPSSVVDEPVLAHQAGPLVIDISHGCVEMGGQHVWNGDGFSFFK